MMTFVSIVGWSIANAERKMTDKQTEALKLALEALENAQANVGEWWPEAITALREALADQPAQQQEPVADECDSPEICRVARQCCGQYGTKNLCASTPPPRKPLTDEEIETLWQNTSPYYDHQDFARAIEAAHGIKEKNT